MVTAGLRRGFVGRRSLLRELDEGLASAASGNGQLVLIRGEPGIGKTRLCEELGHLARQRNMRVAWAGSSARGSTPALWLWSQLVQQLRSASAASPAPSDPSAASTSRGLVASLLAGDDIGADTEAELSPSQLFDAAASLLSEAACEGALLIVFDDLHSADIASIRLLSHVAPLLRNMAAMVVATYRDAEAGPGTALGEARADLVRHGGEVALFGLGVEEMSLLVEVMTGTSLSAEAAAGLHRRTSGNPLFTREVVRLLEAEGSLADLSSSTDTRPAPVPATVREVLEGRLARLSKGAQALLSVAAVIGDTFRIDVLREATGWQRSEVLGGLDEACAARLIREAEIGRYAFSHPLIRSTAYEGLGIAERLHIHKSIARALTSLSERGHRVKKAELAYHYLESAADGEASEAVRNAAEAAQEAMKLAAHEDAASWWEQALSALELDVTCGDRGELLLGLAEARFASGDLHKARQACLQVAELARTAGDARLLARAALAMSGGVGFEVRLFDRLQIELLQDALDALDDETSSLRSWLMARLSVALSLGAPVDRRLTLSATSVSLARATHDPAALAYGLAAHCDAIAGPDDAELRLQEAEEIVELATKVRDHRMELLGHRLCVVALLEQGDVVGADAHIEAFARVVDIIRQPLFAWYVPLWRGMRAAMKGHAEECRRHLGEAEALGKRSGSSNAPMLTMAQHIFLLFEEGLVSEATAILDAHPDTDQMFPLAMRIAMAFAHAHAGRFREARAVLDAVGVDGLTTVPIDSEWLASISQLAEVVWLIGGHAVAEWTYDALLPHASRFIVEGIGAFFRGSAARHLGLLAGALGRREEAAEHFRGAVAANERSGAPLLVARTLKDAGEVLRDPGMLREAASLYRQLGIERRVAELVAALGESELRGEGAENVFRHEGDFWTVSFAGKTVHLREARGLHTVARLLAQPGREIPALDIVGAAGGSGAALGLRAAGDAGPVIDEQARRAYQRRLAELRVELDEADRCGDLERASRAGGERDALVEQLSAAFGLGGRPRRAGDPGERARMAATWRIRDGISRVEKAHPQLGRHLRRSIRTGTFCVYDPEKPHEWALE